MRIESSFNLFKLMSWHIFTTNRRDFGCLRAKRKRLNFDAVLREISQVCVCDRRKLEKFVIYALNALA